MGILARDLTETTKDELREALLPFFTKKTGTGYDGKSLPYRLLARNLYELFFEYTRATLTFTISPPEAGEFTEAQQLNEQRSIALNDADFPYAFLDNIPLDTEIIITTFDGETWKGVLKQITRVSSPSSFVRLTCDVSETTTFAADDDVVIEIKHTSDTFFKNADGTAVLDDQLVFIDQTDNGSKRATIKVLFDLLGSKEDGTAVVGDKIVFTDATDSVVRQVKIDAILDLLGSKADGTAVDGDKILFVDASDSVVKQVTINTMFDLLGSKADDTPALTNKMFFFDTSGDENVIRQVTFDAMLDLLDGKEDGTAVLSDKLVFADATENLIKQESISDIFDLLGSKEDGTAVLNDKIVFSDATDSIVRQVKIDAILNLLDSKEDGIAALSDKLIFADATDSIIKQESISDIFDLLNIVPRVDPEADDELIFIDKTNNSVRKETIDAILGVQTFTEIFSDDSGVAASTGTNRTVDEGFDNFSAIIFDMRLNNGRVVTPFVPLEVWENTTSGRRIAGSYTDDYFTLYRVSNTTFRYYAGSSGMRLYTVYGL